MICDTFKIRREEKFMPNLKQTLSDPKVKEILILLGIGTFLAASIIAPGLPLAAKPVVDLYKKRQRETEFREWNRFNQWRLRQVLKRLHEKKTIEIVEDGGKPYIKLTNKGKTRFLKYKLEEIMIEKSPRWDGKWRIIIYDIPKEKRVLSEIFRHFLRKLEFLKLQKMGLLYPE